MTVRFLAAKLLRLLFTLWLVVTFAFLVLGLTGDPVEALLGAEADPLIVERYRERYGLDRPLPERYVTYFADVVRGDLGLSLQERRPALEAVLERVPATLELGALAMLLSLAIGVPLGIAAALSRDTPVDRFAMGFAVLGFSLPNFFLGILLILLFSLSLKVLPSAGQGTWQHLVMPVVTLGTSQAGAVARFVRSSMLDVLARAYVRTAAAKGLAERRRILWHALPNAAIPLVTVIGFRLGDMVAGAVVTETVFGWPGVGRLLVTSVGSRDLAVVQAILLLTATTMVAANLCVDLLYRWIDPRLRRPAASAADAGGAAA